MYKLTTEKWGHVIIRVSDDTFIPLDPNNKDYQQFLDDINKNGVSIVEGAVPEQVLAEAATKQFNHQLAQYATAIDRLNRYVLSQGCAEIKQMIATGETVFNEETMEMEPVFVEVTAQSSIDPLPLTIEVSEMDTATMEMVITTVDNPAIVQDLEQRTKAQAVVDATPEEVITAYETTIG